jgi:ArsR family transcriptional regulator
MQPMLSLDQMLRALRAAAEPTRLRLLAILACGELTVGEITRITGQSQPRVSRHLKLLCDAGLLVRFREHSWVFYRVPPKGPQAELAHRVLDSLSPDDPVLCLDIERTEEIKNERAEIASGYLDDLREQWSGPDDVAADDSAVTETIFDILADQEIGDLLDIGTGTARILTLLGDKSEQAVGIDISSEMLMVARTRLHAAGMDHCMVRHGDMYHLPFTNESFDTVTIDQVLYQAEDPASAIGEAARILRCGGRLMLIEYAGRPGDHNPGVTEQELRDWLENAGLACQTVRRVPEKGPGFFLSLARPRDSSSEAAA